MNAETVQTFEQKPLAGLVEVSALTGAPDTARPRVLVIEDDLPLAKLLCVWLGTQNFVVAMAPDGRPRLLRSRMATSTCYSWI
jgi:hypothetical protein